MWILRALAAKRLGTLVEVFASTHPDVREAVERSENRATNPSIVTSLIWPRHNNSGLDSPRLGGELSREPRCEARCNRQPSTEHNICKKLSSRVGRWKALPGAQDEVGQPKSNVTALKRMWIKKKLSDFCAQAPC
mmetsp:Transcript_9576/g.30667  ORF Transcript_9576/g.30667 Transcript_9576/m.30667 type:complete len:135 (-) Transcript_9576:1115-1519(-)